MDRSQNRGRFRLPRNEGASARQQHPVVEAFKFLAESCYDKGGQIGDSEWRPQEYVFPFSTDDTEVTLSDYYDDFHYDSLSKAPKVLSYRRCDTEENVIKEKIESLLRSMWERASSDSTCRLEVDFVKMLLLACPESFNDGAVTIDDLKRSFKEKDINKKLHIKTIRIHLPSGVDALIGILQDLGAKLTMREEKPDTLRCACFIETFLYKNRSFESSLFVKNDPNDPDDLVFCDWQSIVYPGEGACFANPGSENDIDDDFICDLRIKAKTKVEHTMENFHQSWENEGRTPPPTLTKPGLNGLFRRKDNGFECRPNSHINQLLEKTNRTVHHFEMDGFTVILPLADGREFNVNRSSGRCEVRYSYEWWPKLLFILDDEDRIPALVDLAYRFVDALFSALTERRLEVRPWRCFATLRGGVNVPCVDVQLLRRIKASDSLDDMLGVSGGRRVLSNRLAEVLEELKRLPAVGDLDPEELRKKLVAAAEDRGVEVRRG